MLPGDGSNPNVVLRNRLASLTQTKSNIGIVHDGFRIARQHRYWSSKSLQTRQVLGHSRRSQCPIVKFSQNVDTQENLIIRFESLGGRRLTGEKCDNGIRVE